MADFAPNFASCSVESLLSVPTSIIFRETAGDRGGRGGGGKQQKNYIFSKSEVSTLLRVSMLSSEMDALLSLVYDALDRSQKCKAYQKYIEEANKGAAGNGVLFRALLPILAVHSQTSEEAIQHASSEEFGIGRVLHELEACANDLGKFAEQNHNMADQLECYMAPGQDSTLSDEKRAIAEIEEEVLKRIENLGLLAAGDSSSKVATDEGSSSTVERGEGSFISMGDLCESLFSKQQVGASAANAELVAKGDFTESQMYAAEALQIMQGCPRGNLT